MEVGNPDYETLRYRVVNKASTLTSQFANLMSKFDQLNPDQFEDKVEDLIDEIENQEIRLKKQQIIFNATEKDHAYYNGMIDSTNDEIDNAGNKIKQLEVQLEQEKLLKEFKVKFEDHSFNVNKYQPQ